MARRTQRIPESQRKRKHMNLTLAPQAHEVLSELERGEPSRVVSDLVIDWDAEGRPATSQLQANETDVEAENP